jgi:hypothetical protein
MTGETMNIPRLKILEQTLRTRNFPEKFVLDMNQFWNESDSITPYVTGYNKSGFTVQHCGSAGCIVGLTNLLFGDGCNMGDRENAADLLGLRSHALFWMHSTNSDYEIPLNKWRKITPERAADVVAKLIETGEVDWSVAMRGAYHEE